MLTGTADPTEQPPEGVNLVVNKPLSMLEVFRRVKESVGKS